MQNYELHPRLRDWFARRGWSPFDFQHDAWAAYASGGSGLIYAGTGTGKTYAAWLGPIQHWLSEHNPQDDNHAAPPLRVLWITPLRALASDTEAALRAPLDELGLPWTLERRTSDVAGKVRSRQLRKLPSALVTTPESLTVLLSRANAKEQFAHLTTAIVDEWHELMGCKRGVQTELALARLRRFNPHLRVWGLSATLGNVDAALEALLGPEQAASGRRIQGLSDRKVIIESLLPDSMERFPWTGHLGLKLLHQVIACIEDGRTALVFTNTRSQTELWYRAILDARPDWAGVMAIHHGALGADTREWVECQLRAGLLRCVVCTSSLDLGVDFPAVDRVVQIGSVKGVARLLQRAGRSGHKPGLDSRVTCVPTNAFELVETAAVRVAVEERRLEPRHTLSKPLDVLAQHLVTVALGGGFRPDELLGEVKSTAAYRSLTEDEWRWTLDFVTRGGNALNGYPEYHRVSVQEDRRHIVDSPAVARRHRLSIGTIVSETSLPVRYLKGPTVGYIEEAFAARLRPGDRFVLGGRALELAAMRDAIVWVRKSKSTTGEIPSWPGGRIPLSEELAIVVRQKLDDAARGCFDGEEMATLRPILELQAQWSHIPRLGEFLIEQLSTQGSHHLFFYPFHGRLVHEGLSALIALRLSRLRPATFSISCNDYGFQLVSTTGVDLQAAIQSGLFSTLSVMEDIHECLNTVEMARRHFRTVARIAGLVFPGYPGKGKTTKQVQMSTGLLFDVFRRYDPDNLLLRQATREVLEQQLEHSRLHAVLTAMSRYPIRIVRIDQATPLAFPLIVDRLRDKLSSEKLVDRVRRMQLQLEAVAGDST